VIPPPCAISTPHAGAARRAALDRQTPPRSSWGSVIRRSPTRRWALVQTGHDPGAWLLSGLVATRRGQDARAAALLSGALAAVPNSAEGARRPRGGRGTRETVDSSGGGRAAACRRAWHVAAPLPRNGSGRAHALRPRGNRRASPIADAHGRGGSATGGSKLHELLAVAARGRALRGRGAAVHLAARVWHRARRRSAARRALPAGRGA